MKKLYAAFVSLFVVLLASLPAGADVVDVPPETGGELLAPVLCALAVAFVVIAVVLIVRAVLKKKRGGWSGQGCMPKCRNKI